MEELSEHFLEVYDLVTEKLAEPAIQLVEYSNFENYQVMTYFPLEARIMVGWSNKFEDWQEKNFKLEEVKDACHFYSKLFTNV